MSDIEKTSDGRAIAEDYDLRICSGLAKFGWLTSLLLAQLVRPDAKWGQRSIQTRLADLSKKRFVLVERLGNGVPAYKLAERGAQFLREKRGVEVPLRGTRDAKTGSWYHRALGNAFLIHELQGKQEYWTEYEILRGAAPVSTRCPWELQGRRFLPDAIADTREATVWIEIENAPKNRRRLEKLYELSRNLIPDEHGANFDYDGRSLAFRKMYFVCPTPERVRSVAKAFAQSSPDEPASRGVLIYYAPMPVSLVWQREGLESATAFDAARILGFLKSDAALTDDPLTLDWLKAIKPRRS